MGGNMEATGELLIGETAGERGQDSKPFGTIEEKQTRMPGAARCGVNPIAAEIAFITPHVRLMRLNLVQTNGAIGNQLIEVFHHHRFRKHRQLLQQPVDESSMEALVKR